MIPILVSVNVYNILAGKGWGPLQMEFLVMHDMSKLLELNLSFNSLGNVGFKMLVEQAGMPNLTHLQVCNNQITELPDL